MNGEAAVDFEKVLARIRRSGLRSELLIRAAKPDRQRASGSGQSAPGTEAKEPVLTAVDATAGFGEDAFLLAAAGYRVTMYERNPVIASLLRYALEKALQTAADPASSEASSGSGTLAGIVSRMELVEGDSVPAMQAMSEAGKRPDLVYLDPMFPQKRKNALSKKKLQFIKEQQTEGPRPEDQPDEEALLRAAMELRPGKIIIKRPLKGPYLGGVVPGYQIKGKLIRYDCIVL